MSGSPWTAWYPQLTTGAQRKVLYEKTHAACGTHLKKVLELGIRLTMYHITG